ncbi:hypothetical protein ACFSKM_07100 [Ancylobacter dichloromethanicus]
MPNPGAPLPEALKLDLYDAYLPALTAGLHRIVVQQSIGYERPAGTPQAHHYRRDEAFVVRGPRFLVDENDIHARSPAQGAMGDFHRHIAHIVLRKRALPWGAGAGGGRGPARALDGAAAADRGRVPGPGRRGGGAGDGADRAVRARPPQRRRHRAAAAAGRGAG